MNPWKIIGWIVLVVLILFLAFCSLVVYHAGKAVNEVEAAKTPPTQSAIVSAPQMSMHVVSFECIARSGPDKAEMSVRNTGSTTIEFAKLFVEFKNRDGSVASSADSFFRPTSIPPGSVASATVYSNAASAETCAPAAIQDSDGRPIAYTK